MDVHPTENVSFGIDPYPYVVNRSPKNNKGYESLATIQTDAQVNWDKVWVKNVWKPLILSWHTVVNMSKIHRLCIMFAFQQMLHGHVDLLLPSAWWCGAWWQRLQGITLFRWESQSITFTFGLASILALDPWNTLKHLETPWNTLKHLTSTHCNSFN